MAASKDYSHQFAAAYIVGYAEPLPVRNQGEKFGANKMAGGAVVTARFY